MLRTVKIFILLVLLLGCVSVYGIKPKRTNAFSSYKDCQNEIGYGVNLSYLKYQQTYSPQLYLYYSHFLTNYFSLGVGYGGIYDVYFHNTLSLEMSVKFYKKVKLSFKPGVTITNYGDTKTMYSMGIAGFYEFKMSDCIHLGPMVEVLMMQDDTEYLVGFTMGFGF